MDLGETTDCTKRMTEATKALDHRDLKGATKGCFIFDSWFSSNRFEEAVMGIGVEMVGMFKTNTK